MMNNRIKILILDIIFCRMDRERVKIAEMKLDSLEQERARLEGQLMDLRQRVDREREELKRVESLRYVNTSICWSGLYS